MNSSTGNVLEDKLLQLAEQLVVEYRTLFGRLYVHSQHWISQKQRPPSAPNPLKSASKSCVLRARGGQSRAARNIEAAFKAFNESLALAPPLQIDYCLAMASRSVLHSEFRDYVAGIVDSNRTRQLASCPEHLKGELERRNQFCFTKIHDLNLIKQSFRDQLTPMLKPYRNTTTNIFSELIRNKIEPVKVLGEETEIPEDIQMMSNIRIPTLTNKLIPNANPKIRMAQNFQFGRHIVTDEDIVATEILLFEDRFASVMFPSFSKTHCAHCFMRTNALIPCEECVDFMYCGERCRSQASEYHKIECVVIDILRAVGLPLDQFDLLTLRTTLIGLRQTGLDTLLMKAYRQVPGFVQKKRTFVGEILKNDYEQVCNLERCVNSLPPEVQQNVVSKCTQLLYGLSYASYFGDLIVSGEAADPQKLVGFHLINNYFVILGNPFNVNEVVFRPPNSKYYDCLGAALYPTASFLNHSCDPNCSYYFVKDRLIMYANRPIKAGEQLFCSYGTLFTVEDRDARHDKLKQYGFQCECTACKMDWPIMEKIPNVPIQLPNIERGAVQRIMNKLSTKTDQILWNVTNFNALNDILDFHEEFAVLAYNYYEQPSIWSVTSFIELGKLVELHGNLYHEAQNNFAKAIEEIIEYAFSVDIRKWFN